MMQFRTRGLRDDRRRRILGEEQAASAAARQKPASGDSLIGALRYAEAAQREHQPHLGDFLPKRPLALAAWAAALLACIAAAQSLFYYGRSWTVRSPSMELVGPGTLAAWIGATLWMAAMLVALSIYAWRRHRLDDYHGRYRIWLWTAGVCVAASMGCATGIHRAAGQATHSLFAAVGWIDLGLPPTSAAWLAPWMLIPTLVGVRLLLEMRTCRMSTATMAAAASLAAISIAMAEGFTPIEEPVAALMLHGGASLASVAVGLFALVLHARYVQLDVEGLVKHRPKKPRSSHEKSKRSDVPAGSDAPSEKDHTPAHRQPVVANGESNARRPISDDDNAAAAPRANARATRTSHQPPSRSPEPDRATHRKPTGEAADEFDAEIATLESKEQLSKAERRRLKKLQRRRLAA